MTHLALTFQPLSPTDARALVRWRYRGRFARYSLSQADLPALLNPAYRYHGGWRGDTLIGFYCAGPDARVPGGRYRRGEPEVLDFGVGLHPDHLGRGLGRPFTTAALQHTVATLASDQLRVTIARANRRSLDLFQRLGFQRTQSFRREDDERFVILEQQSAAFLTPPRC